MTPEQPDRITEHPVPGRGPYAIAAGPDDALWYTLEGSSEIGRLVPGGSPATFPLAADCGPTIIAPGPDGALWFSEYRANRIGRITVDGALSENALRECGPYGIAAGPDGAMWFTATTTDPIGRITTDGTVTEHPLPTAARARTPSSPAPMSSGSPNGAATGSGRSPRPA